MSDMRLIAITPLEMLKQQLAAVTETMRFRSANPSANGLTSGEVKMLPPNMGGIFTQRQILAGGNVMRSTELPGKRNHRDSGGGNY